MSDYNLTPREIDVIEAGTRGLNIKETMVALGIGRPTVKQHRANIMRKMGARKFLRAVILWMDEREPGCRG